MAFDPSAVLRNGLLGLSRSGAVRSTVEKAPVSRSVVRRYVPGETTEAAVDAASQIVESGRTVTIDFLGEDTLDREQAAQTAQVYRDLLQRLADAGLTQDGRAEVSVKLSAVGQALGADGERIALEHARGICQAARNAGTTVTLDMEDHTTTDSTLGILRDLRQDFPTTGAVLQSYLRRTEADCRDLAGAGSRVRLCKGAYSEPESVAYQSRAEVGKSYVRCAQALLAGDGYPMFATHDPQLVAIVETLARRELRDRSTFEYQMLYGIRPLEQERLADEGYTVRVYLPYGQEWYGYLMRRMAERPANVSFFLRSLATRS